MSYEEWKAAQPKDVRRMLYECTWADALCRDAFDTASEAMKTRCAQLATDWAKGAGIANEESGPPLDPKQNIETAGDQIAEAIKEITT